LSERYASDVPHDERNHHERGDALAPPDDSAQRDERTDDDDDDVTDALQERLIDRVTSGFTKGASGLVLGAAMRGLDEGMFGKKEQTEIVSERGDGEPDPDRPLDVFLDFDHPERSVVVVHRRPPHEGDAPGANGRS
jgi:hypothetical protein